MSPRFYLLAPPLVSSLVLTGVFLFLWRSARERFILIWAGAWFLFFLRYAWGLLEGDLVYAAGAFVLPALALARGTIVLWGAHAMVRKRLPPWWLVLVGIDTVWLITGEVLDVDVAPFGIRGLSHYAIFGLGLVLSGVILLKRFDREGFGASFTGWWMIAWGVLQWCFPWSPFLPDWFRAAAYLFAHAAALCISVGILMAYYSSAQADATRYSGELAAALTRALEDFIPICAHCHAVRGEDGGWERLERYVTTRTGSAFSHGICPSCEETHYAGI